MKVSNNEMKESMKVGLEPVLAKIQKGDSRKTRKPKSTRKSTEGRNLESSGVGKKKKKNASKRDGSTAKSKVALNSFIQNLRQSDIISDAQSNKSMPAIPTFNCKDKRKAVNEVFESSGKTAAAKADKTKVIKATKKFGRRLKSDGIGGWRLKGMKTSLYQHQVRYCLRQLYLETFANFSKDYRVRLHGNLPGFSFFFQLHLTNDQSATAKNPMLPRLAASCAMRWVSERQFKH